MVVKRKKMTFPESRIQGSAVAEIKLRYPRIVFWHVPNGGRRSFRDAQRFKLMGVRPGVADLFFLRAAHGYYGLFLEVKASRGRLSEDQLLFESECVDEGYLYMCCDSVQSILTAVRWYYGL